MEQKLLLKSWVMIHGKFILNQDLVESLEEQSQLTQMLRLLSIRNQLQAHKIILLLKELR